MIEPKSVRLLVVPAPPLAIDAREPSDDNVDADGRRILLRGLAARAALLLLLRRPCDDAHDLGVAHLEVGRAVGGFLGPDLRIEAPELVPAPAVDAQERQVVC